MIVNFEALGDRILVNQSRRIRLPQIWVQEKSNQFNFLPKFTWNDHRIVQVVGATTVALGRYYFSAFRASQRFLTKISMQTETGSP